MNRKLIYGVAGASALLGLVFFLGPQGGDQSGVGTRSAPPPAPSTARPSTSAAELAVDEGGVATFLIDAPLEKIKGRSTRFRGKVHVDPLELSRTRAEVDVDLGELRTETFGEPQKDEKQTAHARNWMEIGPDVPADEREANRWARLTVRGLEIAGPTDLSRIPEEGGVRTVRATVVGDLWIHGVTSKKRVPVTAAFKRDEAGLLSVRVTTSEPLMLSLREHDIKPRDIAGTFLNGALEKIGQKIDDVVQISIEFTGKGRTGPAH